MDTIDELIIMFKDIIINDPNPITQNILEKINKNEIDDELDLLLIELDNREPYNLIVPSIRYYYEFIIDTDELCIKFLRFIQTILKSNDDINDIDDIIKFLNSEDGYEMNINPSMILINLQDKIPSNYVKKLIDCCIYINSITDEN